MEIPLHATSKDRRHLEDLADLYAIIKATEHLEKAYARDLVGAEEVSLRVKPCLYYLFLRSLTVPLFPSRSLPQYTAACLKLLTQYKSTASALTDIDVQDFIKTYSLEAPRAVDRLLRAGVPATTLHKQADKEGSNSQIRVAETTQFFITAMDAVKLEQVGKREIVDQT